MVFVWSVDFLVNLVGGDIRGGDMVVSGLRRFVAFRGHKVSGVTYSFGVVSCPVRTVSGGFFWGVRAEALCPVLLSNAHLLYFGGFRVFHVYGS